MIRIRSRNRLAALTAFLLVGAAWALLKDGDESSQNSVTNNEPSKNGATSSSATPMATLPVPTRTSPFTLRLQLRSTTLATRVTATRAVLLNPGRYTSASVRIAIANAANDTDAETYAPLGSILSTTTVDDTTRSAAALALGRLGNPKFPDARLTTALNTVKACVTGGPGWPNSIRKACTEAAGVANLSALTASLKAMATSATEDEVVALAAARAYTRLTGGNSGFSTASPRLGDGLGTVNMVTP